MVTEKFKEMALSFGGSDGGNLDSSIWFCGLEWGIEKGVSEIDHNIEDTHLTKVLNKSWSHPDFFNSQVAQYNQKICWFLKMFYDLDDELPFQWKEVKKYKICFNEPNGLGFKMNLFPISFKNRDSVVWGNNFIHQTGFFKSNDYFEWCLKYRGEFYSSLVDKHKPKLIICTGVSEKDSFMRFFGCNLNKTIKKNNFYINNRDNTNILVVPFFGAPNGILSKEQMKELVKNIKSNLP